MAKNLVRKTFTYDGTWVAPAGVKEVKVIALTQEFRCAGAGDSQFFIMPNGDMYGMGANSSGENGGVGDNTGTDRSSPVLVVGGKKWVHVAGGNLGGGVAIDVNGDAYAWGNYTSTSIGDNTVQSRSSPTLIVGNKKWRQVSTGASASLGTAIYAGITTEGDAYCWGDNANGGLGDNTVTNRSSPVLVVGGKKWLWIAAGQDGCIGVDSNNDMYAWGKNDFGQLGQNAVSASKSSPVLVVGGKKFVMCSGVGQAFMGLDQSGIGWTWGRNQAGCLGDNTGTDRSSPVQVVGGLTFQYISMGANVAHGITPTGDMYGWGQARQAGGNDAANKSSPILVVGGKKWSFVADGGSNNIMVTTSGEVYGMGGNGGALGDNSSVGRSSPVLAVGGRLMSSAQVKRLNETILAVVPGTSYSVKVLSKGLGIIPNMNGTFFGTNKIVLEYYA